MKWFEGFFLLFLLAGCTQVSSDGDYYCPDNVSFIDAVQNNYWGMKDFIKNYTDNEIDGYVSAEGLELRRNYEELRAIYLDFGSNDCKNSTNNMISINYLAKCFDLIYGVNPSTFLNNTYNYKMVTFSEQGYVEHLDYAEYYYGDGKYVFIWDIDDELEVEHLAEANNFETLNFEDSEAQFFQVYYSQNYEDDYGRKYKGVWFQVLYNMVFAGYKSWDYDTTAMKELYNSRTLTNEDVKNIYYEVCAERFEHREITCTYPEINVGPYSCCADANNNGECDSMEDGLPEHYCGDNYCQSDESHITCPADCQ